MISEDRGTYILSTYSQGSKEWHESRKSKLTASNFKKVFDVDINNLNRLDVESILNLSPNNDTNMNMLRGIKLEPVARQLYCQRRNVIVREVGIATPKWDPRIAASLDGEVEGTNGSIEIKCPFRMYAPLYEQKEDMSHIYPSHYAQMQGGMAICEKDWCDYIVYSQAEQEMYVERVYRNKHYWDNILYPRICSFLDAIKDI